MGLEQRVNRYWYDKTPIWWLWLTTPIRWLYCFVAKRQKQHKISQQLEHTLPVVVVGNISVGGSGKTPLVIALLKHLCDQGWRPGVISRGYKAQPPEQPYIVRADAQVKHSGDEPLLIAKRSGCPVVIHASRQCAIETLLASFPDTNVVISDDGLQHYALARHVELVVVDGARGFGNGFCLPTGPLREPVSRLHSVDAVVVNGGQAADYDGHGYGYGYGYGHAMNLSPGPLQALGEPSGLQHVPEQGAKVNAVAGIGNPQRFFDTLRALGYQPVCHSFADHHDFKTQDFAQFEPLPIVMTEKDAVKCAQLGLANAWYLPVEAELPLAFWQHFDQRLQRACQQFHYSMPAAILE
jgi:tetraacyldisaccharide 4'-kinase